MHLLVTGGAGVVGANFVRWARRAHDDWHIATLDTLTYAWWRPIKDTDLAFRAYHEAQDGPTR